MNDTIESDYPPEYERLRQAIEDTVAAGIYGEPLGHVVGWVLVINQQEVANRVEDVTIVHAPWQSQAMSRGILQWGQEELPRAYYEAADTEDEDE